MIAHEVIGVLISENGLALAMLDGERQRAYVKLQAQQLVLQQMAAALKKQAEAVAVTEANYRSLVRQMDSIAGRNQR